MLSRRNKPPTDQAFELNRSLQALFILLKKYLEQGQHWLFDATTALLLCIIVSVVVSGVIVTDDTIGVVVVIGGFVVVRVIGVVDIGVIDGGGNCGVYGN